jgi:cytochrome c553
MKPSQALFIFALSLLPTVAHAQTVETKALVCAACHGANGTPQQKDNPVIWGQQLGYIFIELRDFKTGARKNDLMSPIAQTLDLSDLMPLAQYFSQKPWPNLGQPAATGEIAAQAERVNAASVCTSCHQDGFKGASTTPRLAGQNHDYLAKTMTDFRTGVRANNPGMTDLMKAISESDIATLAAYIAGSQLQQ